MQTKENPNSWTHRSYAVNIFLMYPQSKPWLTLFMFSRLKQLEKTST